MTVDINTASIANIGAEEEIIGGIILDPKSLSRVRSILAPQAFFIQAHKEIYQVCLELDDAGKLPDLATVIDYLTSRGLLDRVGGTAKLRLLLERTVTSLNIDALAELVNEKYLRREVLAAGNSIASLSQQASLDTGVLLEEIKLKLEKLYEQSQGNTPKDRLIECVKKIRQLESPVDQWFQWQKLCEETKKAKKTLIDLALAVEADEPLKIMSTKELGKMHLVENNWLIEGLVRQGALTLVVAESKAGKSTLIYDWSYCVATGEHWGEFAVPKAKKVLIIQSDEALVDAQKRINQRGLDQIDNVDIITEFKPHQMGRIRRALAANEYGMIVLDSLSSINRFSGYSINDPEYAFFMYELKDIASQYGCTILAVHHTNKAPVKSGLDKIAGSYAIPASASDIFLLHKRTEEAAPNDLIRILKLVASRHNSGGLSWKLELNLEDNSYIYHGPCDDNGEVDPDADIDEEQRLTYRQKIVSYLRENTSKAFECQEIAEFLRLKLDRVRSVVGALARELVIGSKKSDRNPRAKVYYASYVEPESMGLIELKKSKPLEYRLDLDAPKSPKYQVDDAVEHLDWHGRISSVKNEKDKPIYWVQWYESNLPRKTRTEMPENLMEESDLTPAVMVYQHRLTANAVSDPVFVSALDFAPPEALKNALEEHPSPDKANSIRQELSRVDEPISAICGDGWIAEFVFYPSEGNLKGYAIAPDGTVYDDLRLPAWRRSEREGNLADWLRNATSKVSHEHDYAKQS